MTLHLRRLAQTRSLLEEWQADAFLVGGEANRRWLSGFTGSSAWLLVTEKEAGLATDFRYWQQAQAQSPHFNLFKLDKSSALKDFVQMVSNCRVIVESQFMTLGQFASLKEVGGIEWIPREQTIEPLRAIKSVTEIATIRKAAAITDQVMQIVPEVARPGMSERELAWDLEKCLRENGASGLAFPVHVASGPNAALPHHHPGERRLHVGETLLVDLGAVVDGYRSDLTRTFFLGETPEDTFREIYDLVLEAQTTALDAIRPGLSGPRVDALAREVINSHGHEEHFGHGLGHGVGLEIHEQPRLSPSGSDEPLQVGMITTVEPGIYIPGWGGVRIEDLVLLSEEGIELISQCPKQPYVAWA